MVYSGPAAHPIPVLSVYAAVTPLSLPEKLPLPPRPSQGLLVDLRGGFDIDRKTGKTSVPASICTNACRCMCPMAEQVRAAKTLQTRAARMPERPRPGFLNPRRQYHADIQAAPPVAAVTSLAAGLGPRCMSYLVYIGTALFSLPIYWSIIRECLRYVDGPYPEVLAHFRRLAVKKALASARHSFSSFRRFISFLCSWLFFFGCSAYSARLAAVSGVWLPGPGSSPACLILYAPAWNCKFRSIHLFLYCRNLLLQGSDRSDIYLCKLGSSSPIQLCFKTPEYNI